MISKYSTQGVKRLLYCQCLLMIVASLTAWIFFGAIAGYSALLGGAINVIPNAYFAWRVFFYQGAKSARKIVNSLYKGEAFKFFLTLLLFSLVFIVFKIEPLALFITYILVQTVYWFAPLIFDIKHRPESD